MSQAVVLLVRALDFAARKHRAQRRKGAAAEPYINHLAEVARLVVEATAGQSPVVGAAALLHDTIEDTQTTVEELSREFGPEVAAIVAELSDDKRLPKAERKRLQIEHAPHSSPQAKLIKIADKISNLRSILASPPIDWEPARQRAYYDWAARVVAGCRGVNAALEAEFDEAYRRGLAMLGSGDR